MLQTPLHRDVHQTQSETLEKITGGLVSQGSSRGFHGCLAPTEDPPRVTAACHRCAVLAAAERCLSPLGYLPLSVPELLAEASSVDVFLQGNAG